MPGRERKIDLGVEPAKGVSGFSGRTPDSPKTLAEMYKPYTEWLKKATEPSGLWMEEQRKKNK